MRIVKHWLLRKSSYGDQITILNFVYPGQTLFVGKLWYKVIVHLGLLDDCCFNLRVINKTFNPPYPEKLESYEKEKKNS